MIYNGLVEKFFFLNKKMSQTPLEAIEEWRVGKPEFKNVKLSYAGRLDPLAVGKLIILVGEENKNRKEYERMDKEYYYEVLLGFNTDTFDVLGITQEDKNFITILTNIQIKELETAEVTVDKSEVRKSVSIVSTELENEVLNTERFKDINSVEKLKRRLQKNSNRYVEEMLGEVEQTLPVYSSYRVKGKPLFYWARNNKLDDIEIPKRKVNIHSHEFMGVSFVKGKKLLSDIITRVSNVTGDFRQKEIIYNWENKFKELTDIHFPILKFQAKVSSGTYIRSFTQPIQENLGCKNVVYLIDRKEVFV